MIQLTASVHGPGLQNLQNAMPRIEAQLPRAVRSSTLQGVVYASQLAPVRTGALRDSIKSSFSNNGLVGTYAPDPMNVKAVVMERGSKPHVIRPVRAKALRFVVGNKVVFAKKVNHPGTRPYRYMERSAKRVAPEFRREVETIVRAEVARANGR